MQIQLKHVQAFQEAFNRPVRTVPSLIPATDFKLRYDLMKEENEEYLEACEAGDLVEIADALGDQLYILCGTLIEHGFQDKIEAIFEEIQKSNMSKLDEEGKPVINGQNGVNDPNKPWGKVLKGINFFEPNLKQFI